MWIASDAYEATCAWWLAAYDARPRASMQRAEGNLKPVTQIRRSAEVADGKLRWSCWGMSWIVPLLVGAQFPVRRSAPEIIATQSPSPG